MRVIKGKSAKEMYGGEMVSKENAIIYPTVNIPLSALPEAKDWKDGMYDVTLRIKMKGMHMSKHDGKEHGDANFEIHGVESHGEVKKSPERYSRLTKEAPKKKPSVGTKIIKK